MSSYVRIKPLEFRCKTKLCEGKASYTFTTVPVVIEFMRFDLGRSERRPPTPDVPAILGELIRASVNCDAADQHEHTFKVAFFKCLEKGCDEYVMGTSEDCCTDDRRIFKGRKATLACIKGHTNDYELV